MLLFSSSKKTSFSAPRVPEGVRLYAVGDIHGESRLLRALLEKIKTDAAQHPDVKNQLVFLGDYIDRGLDSKGVVDILTTDIPPSFEPVFLRGNHDDSLLRVLDNDEEILSGWLSTGARATFASYGVNAFRSTINFDEMRKALIAALPETHVAFFRATQHDYICGDYYFVHAGIRPGVPLDRQTMVDKMWIREPFLSSTKAHEKVIVHGHTMALKPQERPNRIGIDTGAYVNGCLTSLVLEKTDRHFLFS